MTWTILVVARALYATVFRSSGQSDDIEARACWERFELSVSLINNTKSNAASSSLRTDAIQLET